MTDTGISAERDARRPPAQEPPEWVSRLSDRRRLELLLDGARVLVRLEAAGRHLADGWSGAEVGPGGELTGLAEAAGHDRVLPQERLRDLVGVLFGSADAVAGRGRARRVVRQLLDGWRQSLAPVPARRAVGQILSEAPFLEAGGERCPDSVPLEQARELFADGRFRAALEVLEAHEPGADTLEAELLRLRCRLLLGDLRAVSRRLKVLEDRVLDTRLTIDCAELAVRVAANRHRPKLADRWLERARAQSEAASEDDPERARVLLLRAESAWDRGDLEAVGARLGEVERFGLDAHPGLAWRWHQVRGLQALAEGDGPVMVEALTRALTVDRRRLCRHEAGGLWSDLGVGRARVDDLAGSERAFLHAQRLLGGCDGTRQTTLALYNLAEIRLRRGRIRGVEQILRASTEENRLTGNVRGLLHDLALWARFEIVQGRPAAALDHVAAARELAGKRRIGWHRLELRLLEGRALGLLRRVDEAARAVTGLPRKILIELEPEEHAGVFALAGRTERALTEAVGTPFEGLWRALLGGEETPATSLWEPLLELAPERAARVVLDAETAVPGCAPPAFRRRAAGVFRRIGAVAYADRLDRVDGGPWLALTGYLEARRSAGEASLVRVGEPDPAALRRLLEEVGYPEGRIERWRAGEPTPEILVGGEGGPEELTAPLDGGRLVLRARRVDPVLRALFALARRELELGRGVAGPPGSGMGWGADESLGARAARSGSRKTFVGESPALLAALDRIERLATGDLPVLILGESGTGKELAARHLHRASRRRDAHFVAVNCAALSDDLLLSDLFGHARGAFTGADRDRAGVFETAEGGTVFLDEIGDLPAPAQGMLLRVLQEGEVRRVGESLPRAVDVRVVAATHRDLSAMVGEGGFRQDLYYRLGVGTVELPALRDRGRDPILLAEHFLEAFGRTSGGADQEARNNGSSRLSAEARSRLLAHSWPGNVRELENVVRLGATLAGPGPIEAAHLEIPDLGNGGAGCGRLRGDYHAQVEAFRKRLIEDALEASGGNKSEAARLLGLSRQALSYLTKEMRIT